MGAVEIAESLLVAFGELDHAEELGCERPRVWFIVARPDGGAYDVAIGTSHYALCPACDFDELVDFVTTARDRARERHHKIGRLGKPHGDA